MPVATFLCEPLPAIGPNQNGDVYTLQQITGIPPDDPADASPSYIGNNIGGGTFDLPQVAFIRFEVDIPDVAGVNITGLKVHMNGGASVGTLVLDGGWCKRQLTGEKWEDSGGVSEWSIDTSVPMADYNSVFGLITDYTVFQDDARGFSGVTITNRNASQEWSLGEGTQTGTAGTATGFMAQLESFLADNESTRGDTKADHIAVMFQMYMPWAELDNLVNEYQYVTTQENGAAPFRPRLTIEWELSVIPVPATEIIVVGAAAADVTQTTNVATVTAAAAGQDVTVAAASADVTQSSTGADVTQESATIDVINED